MRIVLCSATNFGARCLDLLLRSPLVDVVGVVTAPKSFRISYNPTGVTNVLHADLASIALTHRVPAVELESNMNEPSLLEVVRVWNPDAFLFAGWYHMVPRSWRSIAPAYGLHASLLPDYSGGAPLVWALINGERQTGITLFEMDDGVDSGPIVDQRVVPIYPTDDISTLYARVERAGFDLLQNYASILGTHALPRRAQNETQRRVMPQRSPEDGRIDWQQDCAAIDRFVRAQTRPYPGAFSMIGNERITVWRANCEPRGPEPTQDVGTIVTRDGWVYVYCGEGLLRLIEVGFRDNRALGEEVLGIILENFPDGASTEKFRSSVRTEKLLHEPRET